MKFSPALLITITGHCTFKVRDNNLNQKRKGSSLFG